MLTTEIEVGRKVRVTKVIPQAYNERSYENAERCYIGQFINQLGTVVSIDHDKLHPITLRFEMPKQRNPKHCRFSRFEIEVEV